MKPKHPTSINSSTGVASPGLNPAWVAFIRHCQRLGFGEISRLKIQDGVPVLAEESTRKVKFN